MSKLRFLSSTHVLACLVSLSYFPRIGISSVRKAVVSGNNLARNADCLPLFLFQREHAKQGLMQTILP